MAERTSTSKMVRLGAIGAIALLTAGVGGCNNAGEGAVSGGAIGALAGMGLGSLSGNMGEGAAAGAIIGAVGGAIIGDQNNRADNRSGGYSYDSGYGYSGRRYYCD